jgi:hypothetical protein
MWSKLGLRKIVRVLAGILSNLFENCSICGKKKLHVKFESCICDARVSALVVDRI